MSTPWNESAPAQAEDGAAALCAAGGPSVDHLRLHDEFERVAGLGSFHWNPANDRVFWSEGAYRIFGFCPRRFHPTLADFYDIIPEAEHARLSEVIHRLHEGRDVEPWEMTVVRPDGETRKVLARSRVVREDGPHWIIGTLQDVTEQRRLERQLIEAEETERQRLGSELHDGLAQVLAATDYLCQAFMTRHAPEDSPLRTDALEIRELIHAALDTAKGLSRRLLPVDLERFGFIEGLRGLAHHFSKVYTVHCRLTVLSPQIDLESTVALHMYRIAQEAVQNAIRHGKARHIELVLGLESSSVSLAVLDDGTGIGEIAEARIRGGLGLSTMMLRARLIGATLHIANRPEGGVSVHCRLP